MLTAKFWQLPGDVWVVRADPRVLQDEDDSAAYIDPGLLQFNPSLSEYASDPLFARENLDQWVRDSRNRRAIIEMYQSLLAAPLAHDWANVTPADVSLHIQPRLAKAFRSGELLVLYPLVGESYLAEVEEAAVARPAPGPVRRADPKKEKTWIQIELVDQNGKPVPDELYRLELTDGTVQEGRLDSEGKARCEGIDPGTCKVSFPNIDAKEWKAA